jgi:hypothetical protein
VKPALETLVSSWNGLSVDRFAPWFSRLKEAVEELKNVRSVITIDNFEGKEHNTNGNNDLHCEIALHTYLSRPNLKTETKSLKFHIGRPCCGSCTIYFFGCLEQNKRPEVLGASFHFCPSFMSLGQRYERIDTQLQKCFALLRDDPTMNKVAGEVVLKSEGNNNNE